VIGRERRAAAINSSTTLGAGDRTFGLMGVRPIGRRGFGGVALRLESRALG
jgi:hypothetical protein